MTGTGRGLRVLASIGLAVGALFGLAGSMAPTAALRGLAWGIDGVGLVVACAVLALAFQRAGQDLAAAGFLVFAIGEGVILSGAAMDLQASTASFGAGASLWAAALALIGGARVFPRAIRLFGLVAAVLFGITALQIFSGVWLTPLSRPLPFYAYPVFVITLLGWIPTILRGGETPGSAR